jgi:hypothetical protein
MRRMMISNRSGGLRQWFAWLLLLSFVSDIVVDSIPLLHANEDAGDSAAFSLLGGSGSNPADDHPDCGMPDHGCALSHHHHSPAVLGITSFTIAVASFRVSRSGEAPITGHAPASDRPIRAPPFV